MQQLRLPVPAVRKLAPELRFPDSGGHVHGQPELLPVGWPAGVRPERNEVSTMWATYSLYSLGQPYLE